MPSIKLHYEVAKLLQSCLTLCNPMDCSPPGSSVYGILQTRILEGVAVSYSRGSYTHVNAEFQRIARRDKKAFLSNQGKEIEENNRMGKTRDLFKKTRYQGNISCKDGLDKGQKWYGPNRSRRY